MTTSRQVSITYCSQCRFVLRAGWLAQELLMTFGTDIDALVLIPSTGGVFDIHVGGECVFSRHAAGRFPESKEIKQLVRDRIAPDRDLGHSDRPQDL